MTLAPHTPQFLSPVQLHVAYDPKATCPANDDFVAAAFPEDAHTLAWEIIAWLMTPNTSIQKAVLLLGEGGNGKSTWLNMVATLLGKRNISALPLQKLEADRFAAARLIGKMANICADLPSEALAGTSMFKAITGGDVITGEYKFRESFDFTPFSRLVFSANTPPRSPDSSAGFFQRWVVIPFTGQFRDSAQEISRAELDARLTAPGELSGVLNRALAVLSRLLAAGRFTECESVKQAMRDFRSVTDPFAIWLDMNTAFDSEAATPTDALRQSYNRYCAAQGLATISDKAFTRGLLQVYPRAERKQRSIGGRLHWCYVGIRLTSNDDPSGPRSGRKSRPQAARQPYSDDFTTSPDSPDSPDSPYLISRTRGDTSQEAQEGDAIAVNKDRAQVVNVVNVVNPMSDAGGTSPDVCISCGGHVTDYGLDHGFCCDNCGLRQPDAIPHPAPSAQNGGR